MSGNRNKFRQSTVCKGNCHIIRECMACHRVVYQTMETLLLKGDFLSKENPPIYQGALKKQKCAREGTNK